MPLLLLLRKTIRLGAKSSSGGHGSSEDSSESTDTAPAHGNEISFETIVALNPEYIFVMARDSATNVSGTQLEQEIMENE